MRKNICTLVLCLLAAITTTAQNPTQMDPPRLMVVPADIYCNTHGFMGEGNVPDYQKAINSDQALTNVLNQIRSLIQSRNQGFEIVELNTAINNSKENQMLSVAYDGSEAESIQEAILRASEADVIVKVDFNIDPNGPSKSMHVTIDGIDAFTGNSIAIAEGTSAPSTASGSAVLAREAVYNKMDEFLNKLLSNYKMWAQKGRPINIELVATSTSKHNLKSKVGDGMVYEHVEDFFYDNSKDQRGIVGSGSAMIYKYRGVYFPLQIPGRKGRVTKLTANAIGANIQNYLESVGIESDFFTKGPGHLFIYIK